MPSQENLLYKIESKRNEMILAASKTGIASNQTLLISRELDDLLNMHNKTVVGAFSCSLALKN
ncbi:aspartyl-phosphate phosphatase Spo0E family protein [Bacillus sp. FJAT-27445]|uniref:aspartyl-phosphate phosphatase Spo0E family protein n=1 Tax=Bacillus sp. FJAT-27445 TaxID=1679166 RepID=UPI000743D585|nr:aspartyl-phosphate phosphatase Spo0E family protein [Bacillus sp. FJAT-27445]